MLLSHTEGPIVVTCTWVADFGGIALISWQALASDHPDGESVDDAALGEAAARVQQAWVYALPVDAGRLGRALAVRSAADDDCGRKGIRAMENCF